MKVTTHALERFCERVGEATSYGDLREKVAGGVTLSRWGGRRSVLLKGHNAVAIVIDNTVVTILTIEHHNRNMQKAAFGLGEKKRRKKKR